MEIDLEISDEDYVIERAKNALKLNPVSAKAWMITAKTLYPNNFGVQFEAYLIEKNAGHIKEAAKCFSDLIGKFQQQPELWKEIDKITVALRAESDTNDSEKQFLCEMFRHISSEVQHKLLLFTADHCEDTMEHCRLLLLLLQRFPTAISSYGPRLVDTLISAEKHSVDGHFPVNSYRKLLVCDLLPLLSNVNIKIDLTSKLLYKLLHKAIEFYLCYLGLSTTVIQETEPKIEDPWIKLFGVMEFIGKQLNWESYLTNFTTNWSKESYWQKIVSFCQSKSKTYPLEDKQLLFCLAIFFLYCLYEYNASLTPESSPGQIATSYLLVEAFTDPSLPNPVTEPKSKKRKSDGEVVHTTVPYITVEKPELKYIHSNFLVCVNCWDLLNSSENLQREFIKMNAHLKLDPLLSGFVIDYALYKGLYDEALMFLQKITDPALLLYRYLRISSILYIKKNYSSCLEPILLTIPLLPMSNLGNLSNSLIVGGTQKHLHYLPLTKLTILQYLVKILLRCIKENMAKHSYNELSIGHIFALVQLDWPQEEDFVPPLLELIQQHRSFQYHNFQNYIINVDILEEITYLWTSQGGQIHLDILPHLGQRRIGTRGSDKGVKEEIKQAIRRQIARNNERLDELLISFIQNERTILLQTLV
ncbi:integrator complex subunit 10 [Anoplophora glabripennis]|uniref:integrator complex subunit 10 n=1 Tax=Anoplophora glabripennis TaxID=217634 RepID=UPI000874726F|nr:integrator complex subunit 10 [Anoplophora glabripennis]